MLKYFMTRMVRSFFDLKTIFNLAVVLSVIFIFMLSPFKELADSPGLLDQPVHHPIHVRDSSSSTRLNPNGANAALSGYSPAQIRKAYGIDLLTNNGTGKTIAIVDAYGSPTIQTDLQVFSQEFGLPPAILTIAYPFGITGNDAGWAGETALDVEWAHAIAPGANILLVIAKTSSTADLLNTVDYASTHGADVLSMSWGSHETPNATSYDYHFNHSGIIYVASSGDNGAGVQWPAVSPFVLSVGGTSLITASDGTYVGETAWTGSGGGISAYVPEPLYQRGFQTYNARSVPDVAFVANPKTGVAVYNQGWSVIGGTSLSAPCWAALLTLGNPSGVSWVYQQAGKSSYSANYHDITDGSNGLITSVGYDLVTGLGSPKANSLLANVGIFSTRNDYPTGSNPASVAVGDLNGDYHPDLVVANYGSNSVRVLLNNGSGNFTSPTDYATGFGPDSVAIADVNSDSHPDLIVSNLDGNSISVFLNNGDGTYNPYMSYIASAAPGSVVVADLNGDLHPDFVVANFKANTVSAFLNNGNGTFNARADYYVGAQPKSVAVADLNCDSHPDIVVANQDSNTVSVLLNVGNGTFDNKTDFSTGLGPASVVALDVNGDSVPDLIVVNSKENTVCVLLNNGNGTFPTKLDYATGSYPVSLAAADLNGDLLPDIVVSNSVSDSVEVLLNNGNGTFAPGAAYSTRASPVSVVAGDLNGDSLLDLVVANKNSNTLSTLTNSLEVPWPAASTLTATSVNTDSATLNGALTSLGKSSSAAKVWFVYGTEAGGPYAHSTSVQVKTNKGNFSANITGLTSGRTYYYKAFVNDSVSPIRTGAEMTFSSLTLGATASIGVLPNNNLAADVRVGSKFAVNVNVSTVANLNAYQFNLTFDPNVIQVDSAWGGGIWVESGIFGSTWVPRDSWGFLPTPGTPSGTVTVGGHMSGMSSVTGQGYLVQIHFNVLCSGGSGTPLHLSNMKMWDDTGNLIIPVTTIDGSVTVTSLQIVTLSHMPNGKLNEPYSQTLAVSSGVAPYSWFKQAGAFPTGLSLSSSGAVTGTPTTSGTFIFTIGVLDSFVPHQTLSKTLTIKIFPLGDANGDGLVTMADVIKVERVILGLEAPTPGCDANGDSMVDMGDVTTLERIILGLNPILGG